MEIYNQCQMNDEVPKEKNEKEMAISNRKNDWQEIIREIQH